MPELPEVETIVRQLDPLVAGEVLERVELTDPTCWSADARPPVGARVARVFRLGKQVVLALEGGDAPGPRWLAIHLRMTGRLRYSELPRPPAPPRLRARLVLSAGTLDFVDLRRLGTVRLVAALREIAPAGVDPTDPGFSPAVLRRLLGGSRQAIKVWLLRQDRLVGVGNIYASEALHRAGLWPWHPAGEVGPRRAARLHRALTEVLREAVDHCGTTFSDFQDARGVSGAYQRLLAVYNRAGEACPRCGAKVRRAVQQGRSTFYCGQCQPRGGGQARRP